MTDVSDEVDVQLCNLINETKDDAMAVLLSFVWDGGFVYFNDSGDVSRAVVQHMMLDVTLAILLVGYVDEVLLRAIL